MQVTRRERCSLSMPACSVYRCLDLPRLHDGLDHAGFLHQRRFVRAPEPVGDTTQRDLSGMGSFLIMGLFGLIIASVVNMFLNRAGSTGVVDHGRRHLCRADPWDTQKIKEMYDPMEDGSLPGARW